MNKFEHYVPVSNPSKYVQAVQGDLLDDSLKIAEKLGWTFEMLHPSWTATLQKRYRKADKNAI